MVILDSGDQPVASLALTESDAGLDGHAGGVRVGGGGQQAAARRGFLVAAREGVGTDLGGRGRVHECGVHEDGEAVGATTGLPGVAFAGHAAARLAQC